MMTRAQLPVQDCADRIAPVRLRRQRRAGLGFVAAVAALVLAAALSGSVVPVVLAVVVALLGSAYAALVLRLRRVVTEREMALAFVRGSDFDWGGLEAELRAERAGGLPETEQVAGVEIAGGDLVRFVGAYLLGWVLTPLVVALRSAGGGVDLRAHPVLGRLVAAQESGRSRSLRLLAAGVVATAGVGAVGSLATAGVAWASPAPAASATVAYTVRTGETLDSIAERFGTTAQALASANGIGDPNLVLAGSVLHVPGAAAASATSGPASPAAVPTQYRVSPGETLAGIAARFGTTVAELSARNGIADPNQIYAGELLRLKGGPSEASTPEVAKASAPPATAVATEHPELARATRATAEEAATGRIAKSAPTPPTSTSSSSAGSESSAGAQPAPVAGESAAAAIAVKVALEQVGVPYVWGGASPSEGFDCSGLVMYAYAAAGVHLAHYSVSQYEETTRVTASQLLPGDLVFYDNYSGPQPGHVAMYIGNGMVVAANETGTNVQTQSINYDGTIIGYGQVG